MKPGDVIIGAFPGAHNSDTPTSTPTDCALADWKQAGLHAPSYFRLFLVTLPHREVRLVGRLSDSDWQSVQACFQRGFGLSPT